MFGMKAMQVTLAAAVLVLAGASAAQAGVESTDPGSLGTALLSAGPNPFRNAAKIVFRMSEPGEARLVVYDLQGREMARPLTADLPAGEHRASWDGRDGSGNLVAPGVYVVRLVVPGAAFSKKVIRAR